MNGPSPQTTHPMAGFPQVCFIKNTVTNPNIIIGDIYPKSGAGTKELLLETAANSIAITVSGGHLEGVGSCDGLKPNCSGLEARVMGETGRIE